MRVLHFFKTYWPDTFGGVERTIHAIVKGVARHDIQSDVLSLSKTPEKGTVEFDGHMAHKAKLDLEFASTGFSREAFGRFRELSRKADIVHYHFPWPMMDVVHLAAVCCNGHRFDSIEQRTPPLRSQKSRICVCAVGRDRQLIRKLTRVKTRPGK